MSVDKAFDYILARSRTRESSILAIATIASSASMVLLGLYMQELIKHTSVVLPYSPWIQILGIMFAGLGIAYREVTAHGIHRIDETWLRACAKQCRQECKDLKDNKGQEIEDPLQYCKNTGREPIIRTLLSIPIVTWAFLIDTIVGVVIFAGLGIGYIVMLSYCDTKQKSD